MQPNILPIILILQRVANGYKTYLARETDMAQTSKKGLRHLYYKNL